ncbi:hypothetical protein N9230_04305 [Akkermansiaceae bacterium]|nr:hypothetical protein [Akkermansiaceae bacterium]
MIRAMDRDDKGRIWGFVERTGVLGCWEKSTGSKATLASLGLAEMEVRGIALDDVGHLWITTRSHGVAVVRCDELLAAMEQPGKPPVFIWFDTMDGLGSKGGTFTSEGIRKGPDGRIWVATDGGLSVIDPTNWTGGDVSVLWPGTPRAVDTYIVGATRSFPGPRPSTGYSGWIPVHLSPSTGEELSRSGTVASSRRDSAAP